MKRRVRRALRGLAIDLGTVAVVLAAAALLGGLRAEFPVAANGGLILLFGGLFVSLSVRRTDETERAME